MVPVRGRPLGPLGWLMLVLLEAVVGDDMTPEHGEQDGALVARGQDTQVMERKAA